MDAIKPRPAEEDDNDLTMRASSKALRDGIEKLKLDYFRAGMRHAAEIAHDSILYGEPVCDNICAAADNLKELP